MPAPDFEAFEQARKQIRPPRDVSQLDQFESARKELQEKTTPTPDGIRAAPDTPAEQIRAVLQERDRASEARTGIPSRHESFNPLPDPGTTFGRLNLDVLKGLQSSIAGGVVSQITGTSEQTRKLRDLPSAQEIPFFPNADTIATGLADIATLSPAFKLAGAGVSLFGKANALTRAERIAVNALTNGTIATGAEAIGGRSDAEIAFVGGVSMAMDVAIGVAPVIGRHVQPYFREARKALARKGYASQIPEIETRMAQLLDSIPGRINAQRAEGLPIDFEAQLADLAEAVVPGGGRRLAEAYQRTAGRVAGVKGARVRDDFFEANLGAVRKGLDKVWDDAVRSNSLKRVERAAVDGNDFGLSRRTVRALATSSKKVLLKLGPEGAAVSRAIDGALNKADLIRVKLTQPVRAFLGKRIKDSEIEAYFAARESGKLVKGGLRPELQAVEELLDDIAPNLARTSGIDLPILPNYIPHIYDSKLLNSWLAKKANREALGRALGHSGDDLTSAVNRLRQNIDPSVATAGNALTRTSAEFIPIKPASALRGSVGDRRSFNLTYAQAKKLGMPVLSPRDTIRSYIDRLADASAISERFGAEIDRLIPQMVSKVDEAFGPTTARSAENIALRSLGIHQNAFTVSESLVQQWAARINSGIVVPTTMALATISNASQSVNTAALVGMPRVVKAGAKVLRSNFLEAVRKNPGDNVTEIWKIHAEQVGGAIQDLFSRAQLESAGASRVASRNIAGHFLRFTGFTQVERFNRATAGISGHMWAEDMFRKASRGAMKSGKLARVRKEFAKAGVNLDEALERGALTADEMFEMGLSIANRSQFRIRPSDLPEFWSSPYATFFRTLKTFAFNHSRFIKDEILNQPIRRGVWYAAVGIPLFGGSVQTMRRVIKGEPAVGEDESLGEWWLGAAGWLGGFGLFGDSIKQIDNTKKAMEFAAGPGPTKVFEAAAGVGQALFNEKGTRDAANKFVRFIPGVSQNIGGSRLPVRDKIQEGLETLRGSKARSRKRRKLR